MRDSLGSFSSSTTPLVSRRSEPRSSVLLDDERASPLGGRSSGIPAREEQVVGGEVLKGSNRRAELSCLVDRQHAAVTIERGDRVPRARPAGQARGLARCRARNQSAVHSPIPGSLVSSALTSSSERTRARSGQRRACELEDVSGLAAREAEGGQSSGEASDTTSLAGNA